MKRNVIILLVVLAAAAAFVAVMFFRRRETAAQVVGMTASTPQPQAAIAAIQGAPGAPLGLPPVAAPIVQAVTSLLPPIAAPFIPQNTPKPPPSLYPGSPECSMPEFAARSECAASRFGGAFNLARKALGIA